MNRRACAVTILIGTCLASRPMAPTTLAVPGEAIEPSLRYPVAAVVADAGRLLYTANQRSGTISVIDLQANAVVRESKLGQRLTDVALTPDHTFLLALDEGSNEIIVCRRADPELKAIQRVKLPPSPVNVQVSEDGTCCYVALLWSRQIAVIDLAAKDGQEAPLRLASTVKLPFPPRKMALFAGGQKLLVADAFGGRIAVLDTRRAEVESVRTLPAQNQRGLRLRADGAKLLVAHQTLNHLATTAEDDIHWGNLLTNNLRQLPIADVLDPQADLLRNSALDQLGDPGRGGGDPADVALRADGTVLATLAGVNQLAVAGAFGAHYEHIRVGARPTAVVLSPDQRRAYVLNSLDDSISAIDLEAREVRATISLGSRPSLTAADRGERLFYSARLAHDSWFSCHSCHPDGHTTGALVDNLTDGSYGTPKRVLTLRGVADSEPWAWNGTMPTLEAQIRKSVETTMRGRALSEEQVADLTAFLKTLSPPPQLAPGEPTAVRRGQKVFHDRGCTNCHAPPAYTTPKSYDVGIADEAGNRVFNPPSLRGVVHGGPYFHDGRAATLAEVFTRYRHQLKSDLTAEELADLLAWLRSL